MFFFQLRQSRSPSKYSSKVVFDCIIFNVLCSYDKVKLLLTDTCISGSLDGHFMFPATYKHHIFNLPYLVDTTPIWALFQVPRVSSSSKMIIMLFFIIKIQLTPTITNTSETTIWCLKLCRKLFSVILICWELQLLSVTARYLQGRS